MWRLRWWARLACFLGVVSGASVANAADHAAITYAGAVATTVFYLPVKVLYAGAGVVAGGLSLLVTGGNPDAFFAVWDAAGGGTYVVTPAMLEGEEEVRFVGP